MATVPDDITAKSCYRTLVLNEFAVPFVDILTVFLNWGKFISLFPECKKSYIDCNYYQ